MSRCPRCGKSHSLEDRFCGFCGYNLAVQNNSDFVTQQAIKVSDIQFKLGMVYFKEAKYTQAVDIFEKILQGDPDNLQARDMYERAREALLTTIENSSS